MSLNQGESMTHLWEPEHSHYCRPGDCATTYSSWRVFMQSEGKDFEHNLLFRWDWDERDRSLRLCWMVQHKGLYRYTVIYPIRPDDELSVREWLKSRWEHLAALWAPISCVEFLSGGDK